MSVFVAKVSTHVVTEVFPPSEYRVASVVDIPKLTRLETLKDVGPESRWRIGSHDTQNRTLVLEGLDVVTE